MRRGCDKALIQVGLYSARSYDAWWLYTKYPRESGTGGGLLSAMRWGIVLFTAALALVGCGADSTSDNENVTNIRAPAITAESPTTVESVFGYTYQNPDGNRLVAGRGPLPYYEPRDIPLDGVPRWTAAAAVSNGTLWVVALEDRAVQGFIVSGEMVAEISVTPKYITEGSPVLLRVDGDSPSLVTGPVTSASSVTHPLILDGPGRTVYVDQNGDLVLYEGVEKSRLELEALPDARILTDGSGRVMLLTGATDRYPHGVLGDDFEAGSITLVQTEPELQVVAELPIAAPEVVEGIAPIWADLDGDGTREIIATVSGPEKGARIVVFDELGQVIAEGPDIGRGYRWRHQVAVAPFGPGGELELAVVRTPHIGGTVEFYRLEGSSLRIAAQHRTITSHVIGSRNLDMAAAGDFDGDGRVELLVSDLPLTSLVGVRRTDDGAEAAWTVPVGGRMSTNLSAVALDDGQMAVGVGRQDGVLRVWLPPKQ